MHYVAYLVSKKLGKTLIFENKVLNECRVSDATSLEYGHLMVCPEGLEPPTYGLEGRCSIQLSYGQIKKALEPER